MKMRPNAARVWRDFALAAAALVAACAGPGYAHVYYVDYAGGSDAASGEAPGAAWKHAPGDPAAEAKAKMVKLAPGDTVRFRGGVVYRGVVQVPASGSPEAQLVYAGDEWGAQPAVFDGSDPVRSAEPCPSAEACGGAPAWSRLLLVQFDPPTTQQIKLFDASGPLFESQYPKVRDPLFSDEIAQYEPLPQGAADAGERGEIHSGELAKLLQGQEGRAKISIWVQGNQVERRLVTAVSGDVVHFEAQGLKLYHDRPDRYAVVGLPQLVDQPGSYALLAPGRAVAAPRNGQSSLFVGSGRGGFNLAGHSNVTIRGIVFEHYVGAKSREGVQIANYGGIATGTRIEHDVFKDSSLDSGAGVITLGSMSDVTISGNLISGIERGSGIRTGVRPVGKIKITGNRFDRIGRTGIALLGATDSVISGNVMSGMHGVHGNGISLYLANRNIEVTDNFVTDTTRPMTFHGDITPEPGDHHFLIARNVFQTPDQESQALISWGKDTRDVVISDNVLIAPRYALKLSGADERVVVRGNHMGQMLVYGGDPKGWTVEKNNGAPAKAPAAPSLSVGPRSSD